MTISLASELSLADTPPPSSLVQHPARGPLPGGGREGQCGSRGQQLVDSSPRGGRLQHPAGREGQREGRGQVLIDPALVGSLVQPKDKRVAEYSTVHRQPPSE